jgi:large subunit ribosomal protein L21
MLAVVKTGGKQYTVKPGDVIRIEKLAGNPGESVQFGEVLLIKDESGTVKVGSPVLNNASVKGEILSHTRGPKIIVFKFKRRKGYRRKKGHRQNLTNVRITEIKA